MLCVLFFILYIVPLFYASPDRHLFRNSTYRSKNIATVTPAQLLVVAPTSSNCTEAPFPSECANASVAASWISLSFYEYGIWSVGEQAAVIGTIAYESGEFKYAKNHYPAPGRPGQGTRNMQFPDFNLQYARHLRLPLAKISIPDDVVDASSLDATQLDDLMSLLLASKSYDFGSAAWFLATQCSADVRAGVRNGTGWETYVTECIGTTIDDDRRAYWQRAKEVLGSRDALLI